MKKSKLPSQTAKNVSKLHQRVLGLLTCEESPYKNYSIRQEYRVSEVNPNYPSNREKFDIVILGLDVVVEVHGEHHYGPRTYGGISLDQAKRQYLQRLRLDEDKKCAAEEAGWAYVVISYTRKNIVLEELVDEIDTACRGRKEASVVIEKVQKKLPQRKDYKWPTKKMQGRGFRS